MGSEGPATMAEGEEMEMMKKGKVSVWWDVEKCKLPKWIDPYTVAEKMRMALMDQSYCGGITIYAYGDFDHDQQLKEGLENTGVVLNHLSFSGGKDMGHKKIIVDMLCWAVDNPAPANYLLISDNSEFAYALRQLRMRRYNILLAQPQNARELQPQNARELLSAEAKSVWLWGSIVTGGPPLSDVGLSQFNNVKGKEVSIDDSEPNLLRVFSLLCQIQRRRNGSSSEPNDTKKEQFVGAPHEIFAPKSVKKQVVKAPHDLFNGNTSRTSSGESTPNFISSDSDHSWKKNGITSNIQPLKSEILSRQTNFVPVSSHNRGSHPMPPLPSESSGSPSFLNGISGPEDPTDFYELSDSDPFCNQPNFVPDSIPDHGSHSLPGSEYPSNFWNPPSLQGQNGWPGSEYPSHSWNPPSLQGRNGQESNPNFAIHYNTPLNGQESKPNFAMHYNTPLNGQGSNPNFAMNYNSLLNGQDYSYPNFAMPYNTPQNMQNVYSFLPNSYGTRKKKHRPYVAHFPSGRGKTAECTEPDEHVQALIGVVLLALNTLKNDKMIPTEANITNCIKYGDPDYRDTDVRKALNYAIEQKMAVVQSAGAVILYIGKNTEIWKCVNPISGDPKNYSEAVWDEIQSYLLSPDGQSGLMASQCRYEAAVALRKSCLKGLPLGDVLQILNMVISKKKWIKVHHHSSWQPITFKLSAETAASTSG